ncbi:MAG: lysozyme [Burkholderiales bacterium]|nr:lysozyme [Burkholderiales bacterium]
MSVLSKENRAKHLKTAGLSTGVVLAMLYLIAPHEGKINTVYLDPVGIPTVCYGQTGVDLYGRKIEMNKGLEYSDEECDLMLALTTKAFEVKILKLTKPFNSPQAHVDYRFISQYQKAALISFVYNVGEGNLETSTLLKLLNQGKHEEACAQLVRWVRAKGKVLKGLVSRRGLEKEWCLGDVPLGVEKLVAELENG